MRQTAPQITIFEKTPAQMRASILALEAEMKRLPAEHQLVIEIRHHFAPGIYMREAIIPKGALVTGHFHKTEHLNILSMGDITVWTEGGLKRLTASSVIPSKPGIKRVGYAHEDSVWITVHPNPSGEIDPVKLEAILVAKTLEEAIAFLGAKPLSMEAEPCHS